MPSTSASLLSVGYLHENASSTAHQYERGERKSDVAGCMRSLSGSKRNALAGKGYQLHPREECEGSCIAQETKKKKKCCVRKNRLKPQPGRFKSPQVLRKDRRACAIKGAFFHRSKFLLSVTVQSLRERTRFVDLITGLCGNRSPTENAWEVRHWSNGKLTSLPRAGQQHA